MGAALALGVSRDTNEKQANSKETAAGCGRLRG